MKKSRTLALVAPAIVACSLIAPGTASSASTDAAPEAVYSGPSVAGVVHVDVDPELPNTIDPCWYIARELYDDALAGRKVYARFFFVFMSEGQMRTWVADINVTEAVKADHDHDLGEGFVVFSDKFQVDVQPDAEGSVQAFVQILTDENAPG